MSAESVSLLEIGNRLLVTVPANPRDATISALQDLILEAMDGRNLAGVVLDIGSVGLVDSFFARMMTETADMVRLMGGETVITGLQPAVALTLTELGLTLGRIRTAVDAEAALAMLADHDRSS